MVVRCLCVCVRSSTLLCVLLAAQRDVLRTMAVVLRQCSLTMASWCQHFVLACGSLHISCVFIMSI